MKYIGLDIGGTKIAVILSNSNGIVLKRKEFKTIYNSKLALDKIYNIIESYNSTFSAIGISIGGPIDYNKQIILNPPHLKGWHNFNLVEVLKEKYNVPVFMDNDANCCALTLKYWGCANKFSSFAFLTFGTGLGAGLILNNKIYRGKSGNAGEIGHVKVSEKGSFTYNKRGCVESFCSGSGISNTYYELYNKRLSAKEICYLANKNDEKALNVINKSAFYLGRTLAILVDLLDLEAIIIGSIFEKNYSLFYEKTMEELKNEALPVCVNNFILLPTNLDNIQDLAPIAICKNNME